jgi:hypothetical protein
MTYTTTPGKPLNLNETHHSDGSELIPAEVQAHIRHDDAQSIDTPSTTGYTIDEEGFLNNYAIEPDIYPSERPSLQQQQRYIFLGTGAALFVVILMLIASAIR